MPRKRKSQVPVNAPIPHTQEEFDFPLEDKILSEVPLDDSTSREEKLILYREIRLHKPTVCVEIGTHRGLTTLYMAHALAENNHGHLWTCDPNEEWGQKGNFRKFPELEKRITFLPIPGRDIQVTDIDFLFIDGFHERVFVNQELDALLPRLAHGAVVFFHDTNGANEFCDPLGAAQDHGLTVEKIHTQNGMARYIHK